MRGFRAKTRMRGDLPRTVPPPIPDPQLSVTGVSLHDRVLMSADHAAPVAEPARRLTLGSSYPAIGGVTAEHIGKKPVDLRVETKATWYLDRVSEVGVVFVDFEDVHHPSPPLRGQTFSQLVDIVAQFVHPHGRADTDRLKVSPVLEIQLGTAGPGSTFFPRADEDKSGGRAHTTCHIRTVSRATDIDAGHTFFLHLELAQWPAVPDRDTLSARLERRSAASRGAVDWSPVCGLT